MSVRILRGHALDQLRELPDESVHCYVTSPPYYGLRDYGVAGQLGLEPTLQEYLDNMVAVFREGRRVLRSDGTLWLNIGDSYNSGTSATRKPSPTADHGYWENGGSMGDRRVTDATTKTKDLMGVPWRLAFALQADGWYLRQDIIWHKPNPMPESVRDRCTKAHEYIFLLAKSERYYYDIDVMQEPCDSGPSDIRKMIESQERIGGKHKDLIDPYSKASSATNIGQKRAVGGRSGNRERKPASARGVPVDTDGKSAGAVAGSVPREGLTRNKRSVWTVGTAPYSGAHFATFPPALIEPCILAGCPVGGTVLDPFGGAGTTGLVADRLQRDAILIELNPEYADMAERRIRGDSPLFAEVA